MKLIVLGCIAAVTLAACGADGAPLKPKYTTKTTIGYSSVTGPYNSTVLASKLAADHVAVAADLSGTGTVGGRCIRWCILSSGFAKTEFRPPA